MCNGKVIYKPVDCSSGLLSPQVPQTTRQNTWYLQWVEDNLSNAEEQSVTCNLAPMRQLRGLPVHKFDQSWARNRSATVLSRPNRRHHWVLAPSQEWYPRSIAGKSDRAGSPGDAIRRPKNSCTSDTAPWQLVRLGKCGFKTVGACGYPGT